MNQNIQLAKQIIDSSCKIKSGENVLIQLIGHAGMPLVHALIDQLSKRQISVELLDLEPAVTSDFIKTITREKAQVLLEKDILLVEKADVCIMIKSIENQEMIDSEKETIYAKYYRQIMDKKILESTRWISLRYPNKTMAAHAGMSYENYEKYYFHVCLVDYDQLSAAMDILVDKMLKTKMVHIKGPGTDISFSIENIPVHKCDGKINLPDGEVYTAPIKDSVNGVIHYNVKTSYRGYDFDSVTLTFEKGKIVNASCEPKENMKALEAIFNTDQGARYVGEFALGVNPYVLHPTKDILFDEKIAGSFHLTPGFSYQDAFNGNHSAVHWDLVCLQTQAYGGGEIYFDKVLIRKDGMFILPELQVLNPKD